MKKRTARAARLGLVGCLAVALVAMTSGSASALSPGTSPSDFIVGVPGGVLAAAAANLKSAITSPGQYGAALANAVRYNSGWNTVTQKYGSNHPDWTGLSKDDANKIADMEKNFNVPASKPTELAKDAGADDALPLVGSKLGSKVGVGLSLLGSVTVGLSLGPTIDTAFGIDDQAGLCPDSGGGWSQGNALVAGITGLDCGKWAMSQELLAAANKDAGSGTTYPVACAADDPHVCVTILGQGLAFFSNDTWCASGTTDGRSPSISIRFGTATNYLTQAVSGSSPPTECSAFPSSQAEIFDNSRSGITSYFVPNADGTPGATPQTPQPADADPARFFRCVVTLTDGSSVTHDGDSFHETDATVPKPVMPAIPTGKTAQSSQCFEYGGPSPLPVTAPVPTTAPYKDWSSANPDCNLGNCQTLLYKGTQNCFTSPDPTLCNGWVQDPERETDYTCKYDGTVTALSDCFVYGTTFDPEKIATGDPYADPATGTDTGGQTGPKAGGFPGAVDDPSTQRDCFPSGWGVLNPLSWVLQPVECAMQWAFVPRPAVIQADLTTMNHAFDNKMPGKLASLVTAWNIVPPASGCDGILVNVPFLGPPFHIMQACPGDMLATMASWSRIFGDLMFSVFGLVAITRHVARIFAFGGLGTAGDAE